MRIIAWTCIVCSFMPYSLVNSLLILAILCYSRCYSRSLSGNPISYPKITKIFVADKPCPTSLPPCHPEPNVILRPALSLSKGKAKDLPVPEPACYPEPNVILRPALSLPKGEAKDLHGPRASRRDRHPNKPAASLPNGRTAVSGNTPPNCPDKHTHLLWYGNS